jgi:hypothetical protein
MTQEVIPKRALEYVDADTLALDGISCPQSGPDTIRTIVIVGVDDLMVDKGTSFHHQLRRNRDRAVDGRVRR